MARGKYIMATPVVAPKMPTQYLGGSHHLWSHSCPGPLLLVAEGPCGQKGVPSRLTAWWEPAGDLAQRDCMHECSGEV